MNSKMDRVKVTELAERLVKAGKLAEAITEYKKLLEGDVQDVNISNIIGDLYVRLGQEAEAIKVFQNVAKYYEGKSQYSQALAIYKKIIKLDPNRLESVEKLADLYAGQGFIAEAKKEYLKAEERLKKEGRTPDLIRLFEKLVRLDRGDFKPKLALADLYIKEGMTEEALSELNDIAEIQIEKGRHEEAEKILLRARDLKKHEERTVTNLVEVLKKGGRQEDALALIQDCLKHDRNNVQFRSLLGTYYLDIQNFQKAEEVLGQVLEEKPHDVKTRIKLGRVYVSQDEPGKAYDLYEPLVTSLIKKQKEEKAIGLLGIILSSKKIHLPTLDKLASIYKAQNQKRNLEVAYRVILEESRKKNLKERILHILSELMQLNPDDAEILAEYKNIRKEFGMPEEEGLEREPSLLTDQNDEIIETTLARAELYLEQGLLRNAMRILENLSFKYPNDARVRQKLTSLTEFKPDVDESEVTLRIEKISAKEADLRGIEVKPGTEKTSIFQEEGSEEGKFTSADIFAGMEISPVPSRKEEEKRYYDLAESIDEEMEMIKHVYYQQMKGDTKIFEKELSDIVSEFRKQIEEEIDREDFETHYYLGIAFLEQGLIDEAIEEFKIAAKDKERAMEAYSMMSHAYRTKKDFPEAAKWIEKSLDFARQGSDNFFALKYDLASLYEELKDKKKALNLYQKIKEWNEDYRDVAEKVDNLRKND